MRALTSIKGNRAHKRVRLDAKAVRAKMRRRLVKQKKKPS